MDNKLLGKLGIAAAAVSGLAALFFYFRNTYDKEPILFKMTVEQARQIIQQIKYQMLIVCVNFADKMNEQFIKIIPKNQIENAISKLKNNLMQIYQQKEDITLNKYALSKDYFAEILETYQRDQFLNKMREEIRLMMELAIEGKYPDIHVPKEALTVNSKDRVRQIYQNVCELVIAAVRNKLIELAQKDPNFDCKNDQSYKLAVREINVYKLRASELMQEGYRTEWGCPNQVFFKVLQNHKQQSIEFKIQIIAIQKSYNTMLQFVSKNPLAIQHESIIHILMEEEIEANIKKEQQKYQKLYELQKGKKEDPTSQANYFFQKGKMIEKELKQSKNQMNLTTGKEEVNLIL